MRVATLAKTLKQTAAVLMLVTVLTACSAGVAFADNIADAQARAAQVQSQVEALQTKAEIAAEEYNAAHSRYTTLTGQVSASKKKIAKLDAQRGKLQGTLDNRAVTMYRQGPLGFLNAVLAAHTLTDFDAAFQLLTNMNRNDAQTVAKLKTAKAEAADAQTLLVKQQADAAQQSRSMADNKQHVESSLSQSRQVLAQADATVKTLIAQKKAAEEAAARAAAQRLLAEQAAAEAAARRSSSSSDGGSSGGSGDSGGGNPPTSSKGAAAVYWAMKQIGKPYVWAAAGPNSFDCSGLTMWAYAKVGVSLPHYSREQINQGSRVSRSNLQPGDLVFFGSPIHHVGMYVGSGDFIEAPYSGSHVRITSLSRRSDFAGACRP